MISPSFDEHELGGILGGYMNRVLDTSRFKTRTLHMLLAQRKRISHLALAHENTSQDYDHRTPAVGRLCIASSNGVFGTSRPQLRCL